MLSPAVTETLTNVAVTGVVIGAATYPFFTTRNTKEAAEKTAKRLKDKGFVTRIKRERTAEGNYYVVYARRRKARMPRDGRLRGRMRARM